MVHRDVEKPLDLRRVQVHRQDAIRASASDDVRDQLRGDRHAAGIFAVLTRVAEVRDDRGNAKRARPLEAVDHHQQFHDVFIDRRARGLDQENIAAADILVDLARDLSVRKIVERDLAERQTEVRANPLRQVRIRAAAEDLEVVHGERRWSLGRFRNKAQGFTPWEH